MRGCKHLTVQELFTTPFHPEERDHKSVVLNGTKRLKYSYLCFSGSAELGDSMTNPLTAHFITISGEQSCRLPL